MTEGPCAAPDATRRPRRRGALVAGALGMVVGVVGVSQWLSGPAAGETVPVTAPTATGVPFAAGSSGWVQSLAQDGLIVPLVAGVGPATSSTGTSAGAPVVVPATSGAGGAIEDTPGATLGAETEVGLGGDPAEALVEDLQSSLDRADLRERLPDSLTPAPETLRDDARPLPPRCTAEPGEVEHQVCVVGDPDGERTAVAFGSSHVMMWLPGLRAEAERAGVALTVYVKYGRAPYTFTMLRQGVPWSECSDWRDWAIDEINDLAPDLVVAGSHTWLDIASPSGLPLRGQEYDDAWGGGVAGLLDALAPVREAGGLVTVLGDTTTRDRDPVRCATSRRANFRRCEQRITLDTVRLNDVTRIASQGAGGLFYDTAELTCLDARCPAVAGGRFLFRDSLGHVSATYARHAAPALARRVGLTR